MLMTQEQVRRIKAQLQEILEEAGESMGYKITIGRGSYDEVLVFKVEVAPIRLDGTEVSKETQQFKHKCYTWGIAREALGTDITVRGVKYKIVGAKVGGKKYPILLRRLDNGKRYKMGSRDVWSALPEELRTHVFAG